MCSFEQNYMLQAQVDLGVWLIRVELVSTLALFSLSQFHTLLMGTSRDPVAPTSSAKGSRGSDEVPRLLIWWEGVTCLSLSQSQA